ncbi:MAG TPA: hypothetical protein VMV00_02575 [Candidatus Baltobacteraceae bacterium]|nr:hypothetical protein [Candidatus Baltobacteraceae bacterium]
MNEFTTVKLKKSTVRELKKIKRSTGETYNEVISDLIKIVKGTSEYDEFPYKAQQAKIKELWGEGDYEAWESA